MDVTKDQLERNFTCPKCRGRGGQALEVTLSSGFVSIMMSGVPRYWAISCVLCGYTEFYNLSVAVRVEEQQTAKSPLAETPENI